MFQVEEASEGPGRKKRQWKDLRKTIKPTTSNSQQREFKVKQGILKRAQSVSWRVQKTQPVMKRRKQHQVKLATLINSSALEPGPGNSTGKTKGPGDA